MGWLRAHRRHLAKRFHSSPISSAVAGVHPLRREPLSHSQSAVAICSFVAEPDSKMTRVASSSRSIGSQHLQTRELRHVDVEHGHVRLMRADDLTEAVFCRLRRPNKIMQCAKRLVELLKAVDFGEQMLSRITKLGILGLGAAAFAAAAPTSRAAEVPDYLKAISGTPAAPPAADLATKERATAQHQHVLPLRECGR